MINSSSPGAASGYRGNYETPSLDETVEHIVAELVGTGETQNEETQQKNAMLVLNGLAYAWGAQFHNVSLPSLFYTFASNFELRKKKYLNQFKGPHRLDKNIGFNNKTREALSDCLPQELKQEYKEKELENKIAFENKEINYEKMKENMIAWCWSAKVELAKEN